MKKEFLCLCEMSFALLQVVNSRSLTRREEPGRSVRASPSPSVSPQRSPRPSSNGSVLDVPVLQAAESALDELLAEAARRGVGSVLTEATASALTPPVARPEGRPVKITGGERDMAVAGLRDV